MKNKFNFLGLILITFLVSCSSSDEEQIKEELTTLGSTQIGLIDDTIYAKPDEILQIRFPERDIAVRTKRNTKPTFS